MRVHKYRKKYRKIIVGLQILLLWYILLFSGMQLNSFTNAAFNDVETIPFTLKAMWEIEEPEPQNGDWDKSSLDIDQNSLKLGSECIEGSTLIFTEIYNSGEDITFSEWKWQLFKVDGVKNPGGVPIAVSDVLAERKIDKDTPFINGVVKIEALVDLEPGDYRFKVRRPHDHPSGNGNGPGLDKDEVGYTHIWSQEILVGECIRNEMSSLSEDKSDLKVETEKNSSEQTESMNNVDKIDESEAKEEEQPEVQTHVDNNDGSEVEAQSESISSEETKNKVNLNGNAEVSIVEDTVEGEKETNKKTDEG